ncbi:serine/threonine-protein kinase [Actinomadura parmotrematis]|uniref:non-specific serine/threonine protein kinase n=1 Tax=Actinomadura parmotrematis TaxID=2864039 RepID=A0ABS7FY25_9ACTN|nr:serine/threonine-protein kinase [Actinomadura parmotrematis]MBW8485035.1 serine/threonine protein kinase [Actinomadura parmotrematis]
MVNGWTVPGFTQEQDLGGGVIGKVVLAVDDMTQTKVAIKYLDPRLDGDEAYLSRLRGAARRLSQLEDPNVADFYDLVESPNGTAIVMERVDGVTLRRLLAAQGPTGPLAALSLLGGILAGLGAAHAEDVVHGALRPCNILIDKEGDARLTDFALAPPGTEAQSGSSYAAPELWDGAPAGVRSDLYAATAIFFECLTGAPPFTGRGLAKAHRDAEIPVDAVPGPLRELIASGLAKEPEKRPASAAEFLGAVEDAAVAAYGPAWEAQGRGRITELAAQAAAAPEPRPDRSTGRNAVAPGGAKRRSRTKPLVAIVAALVIVGGVAGAAAVLGKKKDSAADPPHPATSGVPQTVATTAPPAGPDGAALAARIDAAVAKTPGGTFSFRRAGAAPLTARGSFSLPPADPAGSESMTVAGSGGTRRAARAVVVRGTVYLRVGKAWRKYKAGGTRGYAGAVSQARLGSSAANAATLLRAADAVALGKDGYTGTAAIDKLAAAPGVGPFFAELGRAGVKQVAFTVRLDKASHPVRVVFKTTGTGKAQTFTTTYSGWNKRAVAAPKG